MPAPLPDLQIRSARADYSVAFPALTDLSQWQPEADLLLVDAFFRDRLPLPDGLPVLWIEATEEAKALEQTLPLFVALKDAGLGRSSQLTAIGGGVVQDIATFLASLFMRGIPWRYMPTTFLGMADSCLGGKKFDQCGPLQKPDRQLSSPSPHRDPSSLRPHLARRGTGGRPSRGRQDRLLLRLLQLTQRLPL
jgi:hypothetical protein